MTLKSQAAEMTIARVVVAQKSLAELAELLDNYKVEAERNNVHWGHAGDVGHVLAKIAEIREGFAGNA